MVAVSRVADLAIRQTVAHQTFYCGSRLCGEFYRSGEGKDYGLVFWYNLSQGCRAVHEACLRGNAACVENDRSTLPHICPK